MTGPTIRKFVVGACHEEHLPIPVHGVQDNNGDLYVYICECCCCFDKDERGMNVSGPFVSVLFCSFVAVVVVVVVNRDKQSQEGKEETKGCCAKRQSKEKHAPDHPWSVVHSERERERRHSSSLPPSLSRQ